MQKGHNLFFCVGSEIVIVASLPLKISKERLDFNSLGILFHKRPVLGRKKNLEHTPPPKPPWSLDLETLVIGQHFILYLYYVNIKCCYTGFFFRLFPHKFSFSIFQIRYVPHFLKSAEENVEFTISSRHMLDFGKKMS